MIHMVVSMSIVSFSFAVQPPWHWIRIIALAS